MASTDHSAENRQIAQVLGFAAREFDRVAGLLTHPDNDEDADTPGNPTLERRGWWRQGLDIAGNAVRGAAQVLTGRVHPAHRDWASASLDRRITWWIDRLGNAGAALAALPGLGGKLGLVWGAGDLAGSATQILVINAVAREIGVTDLEERVAVTSRIVLGRDLDPVDLRDALASPEAQATPEVPGDDAEEAGAVGPGSTRAAQLVRRVAGRLWRLRWAMGNRPNGGTGLTLLSWLPVVGAPAAFVSEHNGVLQAAEAARAAFERPDPASRFAWLMSIG